MFLDSNLTATLSSTSLTECNLEMRSDRMLTIREWFNWTKTRRVMFLKSLWMTRRWGCSWPRWVSKKIWWNVMEHRDLDAAPDMTCSILLEKMSAKCLGEYTLCTFCPRYVAGYKTRRVIYYYKILATRLVKWQHENTKRCNKGKKTYCVLALMYGPLREHSKWRHIWLILTAHPLCYNHHLTHLLSWGHQPSSLWRHLFLFP
jgi:hypothetical protein